MNNLTRKLINMGRGTDKKGMYLGIEPDNFYKLIMFCEGVSLSKSASDSEVCHLRI